MDRHPDMKQKIKKLEGLIQRWQNEGALERVHQNINYTGKPAKPIDIPLRERIREKFTEVWNRAYRAWKDEGHYLNLLVKEAKQKGYTPAEGTDPYSLLNAFMKSGATHAWTALENGAFYASPAKFKQKIGEGLTKQLQRIKPEEYDDFTAWMYSRHALESIAHEKDPGISKEDAEYTFEQNKNNQTWTEVADAVTKFNNDLINVFMMINVLLGLVLLDNYLSNKRNKFRKEA